MKLSSLAFAAASILGHASASSLRGGNHTTNHDSNPARVLQVVENEDYLPIGDWRIARTCETCSFSRLSISSQAHGQTSQVFRDDGTYQPGPSTDFNAFDLTGEHGVARASIVFGDKAVQIGDWRIRQVHPKLLSVTNENGNVSRIYRSDGTVHDNIKEWSGYINEDLGEPTCAYLTSSFLQLGDWRYGEMGGHLSITHRDGKTATIYVHDGTVHPGPRTDYNAWTLVDDEVLAGTKDGCDEDYLPIGDWGIARTCETCSFSRLSISSQAHGQTSQVFRDDGTYQPGPSTDFNAFDLTGEQGVTRASIVYGDKAVQIRDWRIRQVDSNHLSVTNENGNVSRIYRSDGNVYGNSGGFGGYIIDDLGKPTCAYLTSSFLQLGDWRFGEMGGHLSVTHKNGQTAMIYRHDGTMHPGPRTDYNAWTLIDNEVLAGTKEGCPQYEATFVEIPYIPTKDVGRIMDWIKSEMTLATLPFCWKQSYGRGVGLIPGRPADCPSNYIQDGATCRLPPHDIYSPSKLASCPSGYVNTGLTCHRDYHSYWKKTFFCSGGCKSGYVDIGCICHKDAHTMDHNSMVCPPGYFKGVAARCYKSCQNGYTNTGEYCHRTMVVKGMEAMSCDEGEERIAARCFPKTNNGCYSGQQLHAGLCYDKCSSGYSSGGPVCWQRCDTSQTDCGMGCAESAEECGSVIADQVIAPLVLAANIASLGLGGPGTTALAKVGKTHKAITKLNNVLKSSTLKNSIDAFEAIDGVQDVLKVYKRLKPARVGLSVIDTADSINTYAQEGKTIYDAANDFSTSFSSEFAELTNQEIADEIDNRFEPDTAAFLKKQWAFVEYSEMAEVEGWDFASKIATVADLVDPTGVIALVSAYAKPKCRDVIEFPCIEADKTCN